MKTQIGLWIDHRKAVVVTIRETDEETVMTIASGVGSPPTQSKYNRPTGRRNPPLVNAGDIRQQIQTRQLCRFYDKVITCINKADTIFVFGPGKAKREFHKQLVKAGIQGEIELTETADKMSDPEIAAKVREHFHGPGVPAESPSTLENLTHSGAGPVPARRNAS